MRKYTQLIIVAVFALLFSGTLRGQSIDFTIRFNHINVEYEVYARSDFDDPFFFVGGGSQITLALPLSVDDNPIAIQSVNGGVWLDNSQVFSPASASSLDFHGIASNGSGMTFVNNEEILLFKFSVSDDICVSNVRLFENNTDPQSGDPGMDGGDFNNFFANVFDFQDYYQSNYDNNGTACPDAPVVMPTTLEVAQNTTDSICFQIIDPNPGDTFTATICDASPLNGSAEAVVINSILCVTYTPDIDFFGNDEVCLVLCDQGDLCTTVAVPVVVTPEDCQVNNDTDGDGICDDIDNCVTVPNPDQADCDNDGQGDVCETDSDNDTVPNDCDICLGDDASGDSDGDGICDNIDNCVAIPNPFQSDCDNDGQGDVCETDSDNDSVPDDCDSCLGDDASGDFDGDGICNNIDNCAAISNPDQADCDNDGEGDVCQTDSDNDSIPDGCDICLGDDATGDSDGDGICDDIDNCLNVSNPDQADCDNNGIGNLCEVDADNDGIPDGCDVCLGDDASGDSDGDGICDDIDNCVLISNPFQADCDTDGEGDACEADDDGDAVPNDCDICIGNDSYGDDDGDGICNVIPNCDSFVVIVSNDGAECTQPFTDVNLIVDIIGTNVNLDHFTFSWTGQNNFSSSNKDAVLPNIQNANSGTYTVSVTNTLSGCEYILSTVVDVTLIPEEPQIVASAEIICTGSSFTLSVLPYAGTDVHYEWFGPQGSTSSGYYPDHFELEVLNFNSNHAGEYRVIITVDECNSLMSEPILIQEQPPLAVPEINGNSTFCESSVIQLQTSTIADGYLWTGPNGFTSDLASPAITNTAQAQHEGSYYLRVSTNGCISPAAYLEVEVIDKPVTPILELEADICLGESIVMNIVDPGAASYQWIAPSASANSSFGVLGDPNNVIWTTAPNTIISQTTNSGYYEAGMWQVQALSAEGCISDPSIPVMLNLVDLQITAAATSEGDVCESEPVYLHANQAAGASYQWYDGDPASSPPGPLVSTEKDPILFNVSPGLHQYFVRTELNGCIANEYGQVDVQVNERPLLDSISNAEPFCQGTAIQLTTTVVANANYYWHGPNGYTSNAQNPIISNASIEDEGTYLLYISKNSCASIPLTTEVIIQEEVAVPIAINNGPICHGSDLLLSVTNAEANTTYEWFDSLGNVTIGTGSELLFEEVGTGMTGTYYVVSTVNGCNSIPSQINSSGEDAFSEVLIEVADTDAAYVGDPLYACESSIIVNALASTSGTGLWTVLHAGSNTTVLQPAQASSQVIDLQEGLNELIWTVSGNSCGIASSDTLQIEWNNSPVVADDVFEVDYNETLEQMDVFSNDEPNTNDFEISIVTDVENGNLVILEDGYLAYWPNQGFVGTETFTYRLCHKYCPELCDEGLVTLRVATDAECEAASVMTPNGDGYNDTFIVTCVLNNPGSALSVFNRWGDEVYFNSDYKNDWEGTYKNKTLAAGTYFYNLELNDGQGTRMSGYIYLER